MKINVVLFEPEIPGNAGNIMRTCAATNTHLHLIKPLGFSMSEKYLKRSGVNYIDNCEYTLYEDLEDFFNKNKGTFFYLTRYGHKPHSSVDYTKVDGQIYFVFGKESTGLPLDLLKNNIDNCFRLPMSINTRALNVSNTVAIVVYEALRQFNYEGLLFDEPHKGSTFLEDYGN